MIILCSKSFHNFFVVISFAYRYVMILRFICNINVNFNHLINDF